MMIGGLALVLVGLGSCVGIVSVGVGASRPLGEILAYFGLFGSCVLAPAGLVLMLVGFFTLVSTPRYEPQPERPPEPLAPAAPGGDQRDPPAESTGPQ